MNQITEILWVARKNLASDIHLTEGSPVIIRVYGNLMSVSPEYLLTSQDMESLLSLLIGNNTVKLEEFQKTKDIDFAYMDEWKDTYRINVYSKMGKIALAIRHIEKDAKTLEELILPPSIHKVLTLKQGIFLITGPTGSGKSTTMVSLLEEINKTRQEHIITIEDPIEFVFTPKKSIFSQREVGRDTHSFLTAIRATMREDPNIVVVWEIRDAETVDAAMNLAETWHLVFSTLHTSGSVQTISRLIQFFEPSVQVQARLRLADSLIGVLSQRLIPRQDRVWRIAIRELMYVNSGIKNMIKMGDLKQLKSTIEMGMQEGMITLEKSAELFEERWIIKKEDYRGYLTEDDI